MMYRLLDIVSLAIFAFGALTFTTLALLYWRQRCSGKRGRQTALPAFTLTCTFAFLNTLLSQTILPGTTGVSLGFALTVLGALAVGLLPPLIFHLVLETSRTDLRASRGWRAALFVFYSVSLILVVARLLAASGSSSGWDVLTRAPALCLATGSTLGLVFASGLKRRPDATNRAEVRWLGVLLVFMLACALTSLANLWIYVDQLADYLLLAFFCVCLYYRERLVFFDLLMKRGTFLVFGMVAMIATAAVASWPRVAIPVSASPWLCGLLISWLAAPFVYAEVVRAVDRLCLNRRYSSVEAERRFIRDLQSAAGEEDLRECARRSLAEIFQTAVEIDFGPGTGRNGAPEGSLSAKISCGANSEGFLLLLPRPSGIPFLSDDLHLLHLLAGTLGMILENVRFRADRLGQEHREQQLRLLASRAELKALRAQINPHFLFNSLSAIAGLIHYEPELADETIGRLAQIFRYTLQQSEHEWTSLGEEVGFIEAYLGIEQARFGHRLRVELDVEPNAERIPIPVMSIQPLIENAIRHGASVHASRGTVGLRAAIADSRLLIEVLDNGPGFPPGFSLGEAGASHGLRNVADRLRGYYGDAAQLSWESGGNGTRVLLAFPLSAISCAAAGQ